MRRSIQSAALFAAFLSGCSAQSAELIKPAPPATVLKPKVPVLIQEDVKTVIEPAPVNGSGSLQFPQDDEKEIMAVLNEHLAAYNTKDLNSYMNTLSKTAQGFHYETERVHMARVFTDLDRTMQVKDARIYKTGEDLKSAAVYARLHISSSRQALSAEYEAIVIFKKDPDGWKMSATINLPNLLDS
ncbi:hypothetical protein GKZ89_09490 [Bacillus mangrovi]|uniref:DUF4440 domain-containing protein n=1 Tax=Metabacillus mangrovi TaxID=1491830 RepID=A0A7X2S5J1_9BACI|nr:hypothetical protein [Metabacillus mangrovi]MTH53635.1 hypothetical protein [Metabacillus mangrovi]